MTSEKAAGLLPILTVSSDSRREALAAWEASLDSIHYPRSLRLVVHLGELNPPPGHCTASWALAHERKLQEVVGYLTAHPNQRVIVADVGVQFFPAFFEAQRAWLSLMDSQSLDMLFMRERGQALAELREGEVSTRFVVIHSMEPALRFWNQVLRNQLAEPRMASYLPYTPQHHVNSLLVCFPGTGPQDGAHGISWSYIPEEDILISEPSEGQDLGRIAAHVPLNTKERETSWLFVRDAVQAQQKELRGWLGPSKQACGAPRASMLDLAEARAREEAEADASRIASEIRRLRQELECNPSGRLERYRPALAVAAARLLVEAEALAGSSSSGAVAAFEAVD